MSSTNYTKTTYRSLLAVAVVAVIGVSALEAQELEQPEGTPFLNTILCGDSIAQLVKYLEAKYGERPMAEFGTSILLTPPVPGSAPSLVPGPGVLLVNPDTGTYTLVMRVRNSEAACVVSSGLDFRPYGSKPTKRENKLKM